MADNSFDCAAPGLLCTETKSFCFDSETHQTNNEQHLGFANGSEPLIGLPLESEESFHLMYERESEHLPRNDYLQRLRSGGLDLGVRREVFDWISKAHAHYSFGPLSFCLSINYLDRFLSVYQLPRGKNWTVQLLAVACLSIATKMAEAVVPFSVDLQVGGPSVVFEGKTIQRMEILVLSTLNWRMQACTPFSFVDYFLKKINHHHDLPMSLISRSIQLILTTLKGIDFLEFRPSEIAAAVAISVCRGTRLDIDMADSSFLHVEKDRVVKCVELIQDLTLMDGSNSRGGSGGSFPLLSIPPSPIGVLDAACLSYNKSEVDLTATIGSSSPNSSHTNTKRRKLDIPSQQDDFKP